MKNNNSRTKIVCTLGPKTESEDVLLEMDRSGMDVVRLNFSHNSHTWHQRIFEKIRSISEYMTIFFDLQGPKIRLGELIEPQFLVREEKFTLTTKDIVGDNKRASISVKTLPQSVNKGQLIYINDGIVALKVIEVEDTEIHCQIVSSGEIRSKKGINIPSVDLNLPCLTKKDLKDLEFAISLEPDYIALSFVQSDKDIIHLRDIIKTHTTIEFPIISKIEHAFAIKNFDKILKETDAVMVARGDLGIETSVTKLPIFQKEIIRKCNVLGLPVITATQMLESMVVNPRPTRAEASDVANAIYDGTDAVMLSAETAIGNYPIEAVKMMNEIAVNVERELQWKDYSDIQYSPKYAIAENIAKAAGMLVEGMPVSAIIAITQGGFSAKLIAKHRPRTEIIAATPNLKVIRQLGLIWGVFPMFVKEFLNTDQTVVEAVAEAKKLQYLSNEDIVVVVSGSVLSPGKTNLLRAYNVTDIPAPEEFETIYHEF